MFIIWVIGFVIIGSVAAYFLGQMNDREIEDIIGAVIAGIFFWPLVLAIVLVVAPFAIPFILGIRKKNKDKKNG